MVRRRQRASKTAPIEQNMVNGKNLNHVLEDHFFASPKRKDCKIEITSSHTECTYENNNNNNNEKKAATSNTGAKSKYERIIGVPLATRSQTRTIENFFKNNAKLKAAVAEEQSPNNNELMLENVNECYYDLCDEDTTNDTDTTEYSDEPQVAFEFHSCPNHNNTDYNLTVNRVTCENIFLQEPVLKLEVDKNLRHTPLSKGLELEPIFSSPSSLNGRFNKIVSLNGQPTNKREDFESPASKVAFMLPDNDNSSCDSGVAFSAHSVGNSSPTHSQTNACALPVAYNGSITSNRRRKPTTPHRIVCPSPVKSAPVLVSTVNNNKDKTHANGQVVSPRKSQRNYVMPVATEKSSNKPPRRRLNHQYQQQNNHQATTGNIEEDITLAASAVAVTTSTTNKINKTATNKMKKNGIANMLKLEIDCDIDENIDSNKNKKEGEKQHFNNNKEQLKSITAKTECTDSLQISTDHTLGNHQQDTLTTTAVDDKLTNLKNKTKNESKQNKVTQQNKMKQPTMGITNNGRNRELSEFFPVRRSVRKTKTAVKEEMMHQLEQAILEEREDGLRIEYFDGKGRGVVTERPFQRGEFVVEYVGDLISMNEAAEREKRYALDENAGCYMYYFKHKNQQYCIDATADTGKLGRLVNHSRNGNLMTKVVVVKQRPHLILVAKDDIDAGDELCYDYGDRSKESLLHHPWLAF